MTEGIRGILAAAWPDDPRLRSAGRGTIAAGSARAALLLAAVLSVPLVTATLGVDGLAEFVLITGLASLLPVADLGLGLGLVTALGRDSGDGDDQQARRHVASAAAVLACVGMAGALAAPWLAVPVVHLIGLAPAAATIAAATAWLVVLFITVPMSLGVRVLMGLQRTWEANAWLSVGPLIGLGMLLATSRTGDLRIMVVAFAAGPLVSATAATVWTFWSAAPNLRPRWRNVTAPAARQVARLGGLFLALSVASALALQSDPYILAWTLGPDAVSEFVTSSRLFLVASGLATVMALPLWATYAEAWAKRERVWVQATFRANWRLVVLTTLPAVLISAAVAPVAVPLLSAGQLGADPVLIAALSLWTGLLCVNAPVVVLLNSLGVVTFQLIAAVVMTAVNIPLSVLLARAVGVAGPAWASLLAHAVCAFAPSLWYLRRLWRSQVNGGG